MTEVSAGVLPAVEVAPETPAEASVILLHGLGADGHDFEPIVPGLRLPPRPAVRWVFPHAPVRPVTINGGYRMRAWYDILGFDRVARQDEAGIRDSDEAIRRLISRERSRGVPAARIVLAGFSQGGAMALYTGLRHPERLGGIVALSSYLPLQERLRAEAHPANAAAPIFMAHGSADPLVPISLAVATRDLLRALGYDVEWHSYPAPHTVCPEEVADFREWLVRALS